MVTIDQFVEDLIMQAVDGCDVSVSNLAEKIQLGRTKTSAAVNRLVDKGLVKVRFDSGSSVKYVSKIGPLLMDTYLLRGIKLPDIEGRIVRLFHDDSEGVFSDPPRRRQFSVQSSLPTCSMIAW